LNDLILLAAVLHAPAYGYALKKTAGLIYGKRALHPNIVYPLLKKFVQNGWVEQSAVPGERGQTRKQYQITAAGKQYLCEHLSTFSAEDASDHRAFQFRVALFGILPNQKRQEILCARKLFLNARAEEFAAISKNLPLDSFGTIALDRARSLVQNELRWIHTLEERIQPAN
jgi:DNA-binding PadR family transcriptional regulator